MDKNKIDINKKKISKQTFEEKFHNIKNNHLIHLKKIKKWKQENLKKIKNIKNKIAILKKYYILRKIEINKYSLTYNALKNEELYRKGELEVKIAKINNLYRNKKKSESQFDKKNEKQKLKTKIKKAINEYSMPISTNFRRTRSAKVEEKLKFVKVKLNTPFRKNLKSIFVILFAAFISTIALDAFIKPFGIYNAGLRGITQAIYYMILNFKPETPTWISYLLFIALNIPLGIFGYFMVGKKFTIYTIIFLLLQYLFSLILFETKIENHIKPFGENANNIIKFFKNKNIHNEWFKYSIPITSSIIGAIIYGASIGLIYYAGGSTGGSKFIITWLSVKKDISIGKLSSCLSIIVILFGIILNKVIIENVHFITAFTSITFFATLSFIVISNNVLDIVFSKSKKELISVITNKKQAILRFLDVKLMYNRTFSVSKIKTNFNNNLKHKIDFLVSKNESSQLMKIFSQLDPKALITSTSINRSYGKFYSQWFE